MKYACIARHVGEHAVRLMCRVLAVAPSGFYWWRSRGPSARAQTDTALLLRVRDVFRESGKTYGAPRIHQDLQDSGVHVGKKRVARVMRRDGLVARARRPAWVHTTDSAHAYPITENLLDRQFAVAHVDRVWVSDITYVPTRLGFLYLAVVLDLASRRVVGWAMREDLSAELALSALRTALEARRPGSCTIPIAAAVRVRRVSPAPRSERAPCQHESPRELLGQCRGGKLLRHDRVGAHCAARLAEPRGGTS